jgi:hypothetical protein
MAWSQYTEDQDTSRLEPVHGLESANDDEGPDHDQQDHATGDDCKKRLGNDRKNQLL